MSTTFATPLAENTIIRACAGDRTAQADMYKTYEYPVFNLLRRMVKCPDTAQDLLQETFLRAFKCLHQYRGDAPFGAWLRRVTATEALMHLRRSKFQISLGYAEETGAPQLSREDVSDSDLATALNLLPATPRAIVWLYHVEGYTHQEIAEMAGKTVSYSKSQLSRAHQKLREHLSDDIKTNKAPSASNTLSFIF